jgi:predicted outer membrane repeat protein
VGASVTISISGVTFNNNSVVDSEGGAFYCKSGATLNVLSSSITDNVADDGGAGYCESGCAFTANKVKVSGNVEKENTHKCPGL